MNRGFGTRLGSRLKAARHARGLTQEALAHEVKATPNYLSALERGQKLPTLDMLFRLSRVLGQPAGQLLGDRVVNDDWLDQVTAVALTIPKADRKLALALLETVATRRR